ncbi:hypothetical protein CC80DRAFT_487643 [Byssothecium circinans]|uniref:Uncharacterized protein n=1 Tax=Byssothecium circinans TaxID=147558 RepID=A0A6A5UB20_9PLEO|nr:hypothetical protein CC80DRAFT_487643 [Byssothecium circinans]
MELAQDSNGDDPMSSPHNSSEPESDDHEVTSDTFISELQECLDDVQYDGKFYTFHSHNTYTNPGLDLYGYGTVGLPLSTRDAKGIASICRQAPFGKGDETLIDESVRKTWELDAKDFECRNPSWTTYLNTLVAQTAEDLGVQVQTRAERYKLLLYEEGAFFKAHRDTEKVPGMFGTLVICLPSLHSGGEVYLAHGKKKQKLETAPTSAWELSTLAWYADVSHEIRPVTSGYRLVLTYNLVQDQFEPKQTAAALDASHARFAKVLQGWNKNSEVLNLEKLLYPLEHQYTEASLSLRSLKGQDAAKGRYLEQLCSKNGVFWFLGQMTREEAGEDYGYGYDDGEEDNKYSLDYVVTPAGTRINLNLDEIDTETELLADLDDLYHGRHADSEDEGEFTGNENMPSQYRYHDSVVILMRKLHLVEKFFERSFYDPNLYRAFLKFVYDDYEANPDEKSAEVVASAIKCTLQETVTFLLPKTADKDLRATRFYNSTVYGYGPLSESRQIEDWQQLFAEVADRACAMGRSDLVRDALQKLVRNTSWTSSTSLMKLVATFVEREATAKGANSAEIWSEWLSFPPSQTPTYETINQYRKVLDDVRSQSAVANSPSFYEWEGARIGELLRLVNSYSISDVKAMVELLLSPWQAAYMEIILPVVLMERCCFSALALLSGLGRHGIERESFRSEVVKPTFQALIRIDPPIIKLTLANLGMSKSANSNTRTGPKSSNDVVLSDENQPSASFYAFVLKQTISMGLYTEATRLLEHGLPDLPNDGSNAWSEWKRLFSFIEKLFDAFKVAGTGTHQQTTQAFILPSLTRAAQWLSPRRPIEPRDWSRTTNHVCSQPACQELRRFLHNPRETVGRFKYANYVHEHLKSALGYRHYKFEVERGRYPYTLVVYKTKSEWEAQEAQWQADVKQMRDVVTRLKGHKHCKNVLGDEGAKKLEEVALMVTQIGTRSTSLYMTPATMPAQPQSLYPANPAAQPRRSYQLPAPGGMRAQGLGPSIVQPFHPTSGSAQNVLGGGANAQQKGFADVIDLTDDGS